MGNIHFTFDILKHFDKSYKFSQSTPQLKNIANIWYTLNASWAVSPASTCNLNTYM